MLDSISCAVQRAYAEKHRKYHDFSHITRMLAKLEKCNINPSNELLYAIYFHDFVYDVDSKTNEEDSCNFLRMYADNFKLPVDVIRTCELIMATKHHQKDDADIEKQIIIALDLDIFNSPEESELYAYEDGIFYEYQKYPLQDYIRKRKEFLFHMQECFGEHSIQSDNISKILNYINNKKYKIGVYAGSFNPYHNGHEDITQQAEQIFDKVILAQGFNVEKEQPVPIKSKYRQTIQYNGLLINLFNKEPQCTKYLIRGLRNSLDIAYEETMRNTLLDMQQINIVYFFCQKQYEHVSSSMIRQLMQYDGNHCAKYLPQIY